MFTPQRKAWPGWSLTPLKRGSGPDSTPISNGPNLSEDGTAGKGKSVVFVEPVTPPLGRVSENAVGPVDPEALTYKVSKLEQEVGRDCSYNLFDLLLAFVILEALFGTLSISISNFFFVLIARVPYLSFGF